MKIEEADQKRSRQGPWGPWPSQYSMGLLGQINQGHLRPVEELFEKRTPQNSQDVNLQSLLEALPPTHCCI